MDELIVIFALTVPLLGLFVLLVYLRRIENSERMAMIEKGVDPSLFATKKRSTSGSLRISLLLIGIGVGFLAGSVWTELTRTGISMGNPLPYFTMIFIFGGLGLLTAYFIEEKKNRQNP